MDTVTTVDVSDDGVVSAYAEMKERDPEKAEIAPIKGLLGIENATGKESAQMAEIYAYFAEKAQGPGDLLYQIRQVENRMSPPRLGETRLSKLATWVGLRNQLKANESMLNQL